MTDRFALLPDGTELWIHNNTARVRPHPTAPWGPPRPLVEDVPRPAPTTGARATDPGTAHEAGNRDRTTDRQLALAILRQHPAGLTDDALGELMERRPTSSGKRRHELVELGLVEYSGQRRPTRTGSPARVWRAIGDAS